MRYIFLYLFILITVGQQHYIECTDTVTNARKK